ncbi:MAG TPA: hypothetical protein VFA20_34605 [Myxococcaceae bacterium]|nr:hypothetical protein [Myxococcaceae bacterium]
MPLKLLEVGIGMAMVYLLLSMLVTGVVELWAAIWDKRAKVLARGLQAMLGAAANAIYEHGLVKGLKIGSGPPSYIPSDTFSRALLDLVAPGAKTPDDVLKAIDAGATPLDAKLKEALRALVNAAAADMERLRREVESWFNAAMDRVSGTYRRSTQWGLMIASALVAVSVNVDSIRIANTLLNDDALREATVKMVETTVSDPEFQDTVRAAGRARMHPGEGMLVPPPGTAPSPGPGGGEGVAPDGGGGSGLAQPGPSGTAPAQALSEEEQEKAEDQAKQRSEAAQKTIQKSLSAVTELGMPIGWGSASSRQYFFDHPLISLLGLLVTALAIAQGAPFWFDLLQRFVGIRTTVKPMVAKAQQDDQDGK